MKREEEIKQAAAIYIDKWYKEHHMNKEAYPIDVQASTIDFIAGAEWSDKNPSEDDIAAYLGKKGWPLSTYGIPTYEEAYKIIKESYSYKKDCGFIKDGIEIMLQKLVGFFRGKLKMNKEEYPSPFSLCSALVFTLLVLILFGHNLILEIWSLILFVCIIALWYLKK